jgi:hypothetical protein
LEKWRAQQDGTRRDIREREDGARLVLEEYAGM